MTTILESLKPERREDLDDAGFVMNYGDEDSPYDENSQIAMVQRMLQYHYDEYDSWAEIAQRVIGLVESIEEMGFTVVPQSLVTEAMLVYSRPGSDDTWHWAQNINAMLRHGYCKECYRVPMACVCPTKA